MKLAKAGANRTPDFVLTFISAPLTVSNRTFLPVTQTLPGHTPNTNSTCLRKLKQRQVALHSQPLYPRRVMTRLRPFSALFSDFPLPIGFRRAFVTPHRRKRSPRKRTPTHPRRLYLHTCSSPRNGVRKSKKKVQVSVSVCSHSFIHRSTHIRPGDVAKRLGTKWKSMSDEEKEVRRRSLSLSSSYKVPS